MEENFLLEYIDYFKDYLILRNKSHGTINEYDYDLIIFNKFLLQKEIIGKLKSISDIDERIIEKFMIFLRRERLNKKGEPLSPTTINRKLISLRSFFNFLIKKSINI